jgi:hypothetical protein
MDPSSSVNVQLWSDNLRMDPWSSVNVQLWALELPQPARPAQSRARAPPTKNVRFTMRCMIDSFSFSEDGRIPTGQDRIGTMAARLDPGDS